MYGNYKGEYSDSGILDKISSIIGKISNKTLRQIITLYLMLQNDKVPTWAKVAIVGTLGYLICPIDLLPDFLPGGLVDDIAAVSALCAEVAIYKTREIEQEVNEMMNDF